MAARHVHSQPPFHRVGLRLGGFVVQADGGVLAAGGELEAVRAVVESVHLVVLLFYGVQALAAGHVPVLHRPDGIRRHQDIFKVRVHHLTAGSAAMSPAAQQPSPAQVELTRLSIETPVLRPGSGGEVLSGLRGHEHLEGLSAIVITG